MGNTNPDKKRLGADVEDECKSIAWQVCCQPPSCSITGSKANVVRAQADHTTHLRTYRRLLRWWHLHRISIMLTCTVTASAPGKRLLRLWHLRLSPEICMSILLSCSGG